MPEVNPQGKRRSIPELWPAVCCFVFLVIVLFSGLLPLWVAGGLAFAGVMESGQAEPLRWAVSYGLGLIGLALSLWGMSGRRRSIWLAIGAAAMAGSIFTFCAVAGTAPSWPLRLAGSARAAPVPAQSPKAVAGVISALPLFWNSGDAPHALIRRAREQALLDASSLDLRAVDRVDAVTLAQFDRLLLAQPRLLQPAELVALDAWVRGGGLLVVLADPLLLWPSDLAMGDARRPPLTSLLDPLLTHWGLRLEPAMNAEAGVERRVLTNGAVVMLAGASRFGVVHPGCRLREQGLMAVCTPGRGKVRLIADADMMDDRLWLVEADARKISAATASDAVALIDGWLLDPTLDVAAWPINRVRDEASLLSGIRWALLVGLGLIGAAAFMVRARDRPGKFGKSPRPPYFRQDNHGT